MISSVAQRARVIRRDAILDAAEQLIRTRGYEQMSIQDVQDELGVSRGAIYHYFDSKSAILQAVLDRMVDAGTAVVEPIASDPDLSAVDKLQAVFASGGRWKIQRSELLLALLRSWQSDDNDLVRMRLVSTSSARITPILAQILRQGVAEGTFSATFPDDTAVVLTALLYGSSDSLVQLVLDRHDGLITFEEVERRMAAYTEAIERILGLPAGSFILIDRPSLHVWFD